MPKVIIKDGRTYINCPGCKTVHSLNTDKSKSPCWTFNGDMEKPTFKPSILEKSGHYCDRGGLNAENCEFCKEDYGLCYICHSFVTEGKIQFLSDCTHELAGQTVDLLEIVDNG